MPAIRTLSRIVFLAILPACTNLKEVADYSSAAAKNIRKFEELPYGFSRACRDKCFVDQLEKDEFLLGCDCRPSAEADSVTLLLYRVVRAYYDQLEKLSGNEATHYRYGPLLKAVQTGDFGGFLVSAEQAEAYSRIGNILTRALADGYRKKKLAEYIGDADPHIRLLLETLRFNLLENLVQRIETQRERLKNYYFDLFSDSLASAYEKKKTLEDYYAELSAIENKKKQIGAYAKALQSLAEGHRRLFEHRQQLKAVELGRLLSGYIGDLREIAAEIDHLKIQD